ncbi:MAG TPA: Fic family protein [Rhizomicrobium sp.]|nr:Fic family protein [Rhizomicrobium sp.]
MIFQAPKLEQVDLDVLRLIADQKERLKIYTQSNPRRWFGSLRRGTFARAIQGSNSIEGINASVDDVMAVIEDEPVMDEKTEIWHATKGYRDAMTYIMQAVQDPSFEFGKQFLKSLHFMIVSYDLSKNPGQWRPGSIRVVNEKENRVVYEAPDVEFVDSFVGELIDYLKKPVVNEHPITRAAMAHLNLTMIHPFSDGNGRMARALQTLVLGREGILHPIFSSIEEWLGGNTEKYYAILAETGDGAWHPERDTLGWVRFCIVAHYQQAQTLLRRNEEYEALYEEIAKIAAQEKLPDRTVLPLFDASLGWKITNPRYRGDTEVTEFVASRDLKRLSELGLLEPQGEKRGRYYMRSKRLAGLRAATRVNRPIEDPYEAITGRMKGIAERRNLEPLLPGI